MSESEIITYQGKMFRKTGEVRSPRQGDFYLCGKRGNHVQASSDHPLCAASKYPILAELPAEPAQPGAAIKIYVCACTACDADFSLPKDQRGKFPKYCPYCGSLDITQTAELARWEGGK